MISDVEIEQELNSLQSGNGQLRGESFYQEALKELLALRKAFSEPFYSLMMPVSTFGI